MKLLITFIVLSIINVIFSTVRSIVTIKGNKIDASLISGGYFAFYNIMLIYTVANFPMWEKCIITFVCNVIGVYLVKSLEDKMRKDKLWKIEATFDSQHLKNIDSDLKAYNIPHNYLENIGKYCIFNIYCATCGETAIAKEIVDKWGGKYFASETKIM